MRGEHHGQFGVTDQSPVLVVPSLYQGSLSTQPRQGQHMVAWPVWLEWVRAAPLLPPEGFSGELAQGVWRAGAGILFAPSRSLNWDEGLNDPILSSSFPTAGHPAGSGGIPSPASVLP